ncbi:MAG: heavy-metal-associated domain-containing protein [Gemmatimonadetes bacterium]|nr:heavy-metal-associated domain-containing protein [Gemmatimonadota bacterium]
MRNEKLLLLVAAAILGTAALPEVGWTQENRSQAQPAVASGPQQIEMIVHGLSCPFCAYGLEKKLRKLEGLDSVSVDFKTGKVFLLLQDGSKATDGRLKELVKDAGFEVVKIERSAPQGGPSGGP